MKICQINCVYGVGSTGKIVKVLHEQAKSNGNESIVIHALGKGKKREDGVYTVSNHLLSKLTALYRILTGRLFDGAFIQSKRLISILKKEKPDFVHIHCINGNNFNAYKLFDYLCKNKIPTVLTLHAEFNYTGGCAHAFECEKWLSGCGKCPIKRQAPRSLFLDGTAHNWKAQYKSYAKFDCKYFKVVAVSPWLMQRAEQSPMLSRFSPTCVYNGIDTSVFYRRENAEEFKKENNVPDSKKIIFHVTAEFNTKTDNAKGGRYVVELAERLKDEPYIFVVAANNATFETLPENVKFIGRTKDQDELARWYSASDVTLITSKRETFSMPVAESMCCGTPLVGFLAGGPESIALDNYSLFVEYGNIDALEEAIKSLLTSLAEDRYNISKLAINAYSDKKMYLDYQKVYSSFVFKENN